MPRLRFSLFVFASFTVAVSLLALRVPAAEGTVRAPAPVPHYPVGWCVRGDLESVAEARAVGFDHVELALSEVLALSDDGFARFAARFRAMDFRAVSGYDAVPREIQLVGPGADSVRQAEHLAHLVTRARLLRLPYLILNAGESWRVPEGVSREAAFRQLAVFSRRFAQIAASQNITVLLEPARKTESNMITTIAEAVALIAAVKQPNFQLAVDYAALRAEPENVQALLAARGHVRLVHLANPGKAPGAFPREKTESGYAEFFALLKTIGYRGPLSIRAEPERLAVDAPRALALLRAEAQALVAE